MIGVRAGTLSVKVTSAVLRRDTELLGKMSPFVEITLGTQTKRTATHKKGGKNPNFHGEVLQFEVNDELSMKVVVWDFEKVGKNDLVADATYQIERVTKGEIIQAPIEVFYKNKMNGTVYVEFEFQQRTLSKTVGQQLLSNLKIGAYGGEQAMSRTDPVRNDSVATQGMSQEPAMGQASMAVQQQRIMQIQQLMAGMIQQPYTHQQPMSQQPMMQQPVLNQPMMQTYQMMQQPAMMTQVQPLMHQIQPLMTQQAACTQFNQGGVNQCGYPQQQHFGMQHYGMQYQQPLEMIQQQYVMPQPMMINQGLTQQPFGQPGQNGFIFYGQQR